MSVATFVHDGDAIDYTPGSDVAPGAVVVLAELIGIAKQAIKAGTLGALAVVGIFDVPKATGVTINVGNALYWDAGNQRVSLTGGSGLLPRLGNAVADAASAATTVRVRLNSGISDYSPLTPP